MKSSETFSHFTAPARAPRLVSRRRKSNLYVDDVARSPSRWTRSSSLTQSAISASCAEGEMILSGLSRGQGVRPQLTGPPRSRRTDPGALHTSIHFTRQTDTVLVVVTSTTSLCRRASAVAQFGSSTISTSADSDGRRRTDYGSIIDDPVLNVDDEITIGNQLLQHR